METEASENRNKNAGHDFPESSVPIYKQREEYIKKLEQWIQEAKLWHDFQNFIHAHSSTSHIQQSYYNVPRQSTTIPNNTQNRTSEPVFGQGTYEFTIPPLWKRFVAEMFDFIILFVIKMLLTFFILESFNFLSLEHYGIDSLQKSFKNPKVAMQMSIEILTLEIIHRFIVCCYEVYWLKGGQCATPGKRYMGLMVIRAENIVPVAGRPEGTVRAQLCSPLGLQKAIIRAIVKNLFIGLMLPICFAFYVFRYNRTGYDIVATSLVVEHDPNLPFRPVD